MQIRKRCKLYTLYARDYLRENRQRLLCRSDLNKNLEEALDNTVKGCEALLKLNICLTIHHTLENTMFIVERFLEQK